MLKPLLRIFAACANLLDRADRLDRAVHDLRGARSTGVIAQVRFEELGIGEDDAKLVVQPMEEGADIFRLVHLRSLATQVRELTLTESCLSGGAGLTALWSASADQYPALATTYRRRCAPNHRRF